MPIRQRGRLDRRRSSCSATTYYVNATGYSRRAGVSPSAPYHHFPDKHALLGAVAEVPLSGDAPTASDVEHRAVIAIGEPDTI
jgi:AcrR family transcriptional regulator